MFMKEKHFKLLRWAPVVASVVLIIVIAIISITTVSELKDTTRWREKTFQVVLDAQTFEDKLIDAQSSLRGYVGSKQSNLLIAYQTDTNTDFQELNRLAELTRDNPGQQQRLKNLSAAVKAVFDYDNKVVGVYARQGVKAALQINDAIEIKDDTDRAIGELNQFTDEEKKLLAERDAKEQKDYHHAADLLVLGSLLVAALLIFANFIAGREMGRRRRAEAEQRELIEKLQTALTEVKTLSGLIPICGWCKQVRNDTGYWQSVEQYVHAHTDATFTHGICPVCQDKFKADIKTQNPDKHDPKIQKETF
jgi:CHASE3 domain sensor protein